MADKRRGLRASVAQEALPGPTGSPIGQLAGRGFDEEFRFPCGLPMPQSERFSRRRSGRRPRQACNRSLRVRFAGGAPKTPQIDPSTRATLPPDPAQGTASPPAVGGRTPFGSRDRHSPAHRTFRSPTARSRSSASRSRDHEAVAAISTKTAVWPSPRPALPPGSKSGPHPLLYRVCGRPSPRPPAARSVAESVHSGRRVDGVPPYPFRHATSGQRPYGCSAILPPR